VIVADANLLAYLVLPGERTDDAEAVLLQDPVWVAPRLWVSELRSVLNKYVARGDLTITRAVALMNQAGQVLDGREVEVDSRAVLDLASKSRCSTYDCEYVALAVALGVPLVTTDRAILRAFPRTAVSPEHFSDT
jgi:predicted nucleic acid-binding protein